MTGWYRRFIKCRLISVPLTDTLKRAKKFIVTLEAEMSFEKLKRAISYLLDFASSTMLMNTESVRSTTTQKSNQLLPKKKIP